MYRIYNAILCLATVALAPVLIGLLLFKKRYRGGFFHKWGLFPWKDLVDHLPASPLWVHAVSVGEVTAALPLIKELQQRYASAPLLLSTATPAGKFAAEQNAKTVDRIIYFPFDYPFIARMFVSRIHPCVFIALETELWPNFLRELTRQSIPAVIISGRISRRSFRTYRVFKFFFKQVLKNIACFCMQSSADAERIIAMGAASQRVFVAGNLKFDQHLPEMSMDEQRAWYRRLQLEPGKKIIIAGSTHRGEEEVVLDVYQELKKDFPDLALILAPRHPERFAEAEIQLKARRMVCRRKTALANSPSTDACEVILLDTIGELAKVYSIGTIVFVGGSFVQIGGHNVLEPAALKKPIIVGPYMSNFQEIADTLKKNNGIIQVHTKEEFIAQARLLLHNDEFREILGSNAFHVVAENSGALTKSMEIIQPIIDQQLS